MGVVAVSYMLIGGLDFSPRITTLIVNKNQRWGWERNSFKAGKKKYSSARLVPHSISTGLRGRLTLELQPETVTNSSL